MHLVLALQLLQNLYFLVRQLLELFLQLVSFLLGLLQLCFKHLDPLGLLGVGVLEVEELSFERAGVFDMSARLNLIEGNFIGLKVFLELRDLRLQELFQKELDSQELFQPQQIRILEVARSHLLDLLSLLLPLSQLLRLLPLLRCLRFDIVQLLLP